MKRLSRKRNCRQRLTETKDDRSSDRAAVHCEQGGCCYRIHSLPHLGSESRFSRAAHHEFARLCAPTSRARRLQQVDFSVAAVTDLQWKT